jgi:hypothetical protein
LKRVRAISACLLLFTGVCQASVTVSGDVANPGPVELPARGRLLDVISVAQPNAEGYWLAGVLLRQSLIEQQTRLKAGVLFDLEVLQRMAMLFDRPSRAALAVRLAEQVRRMPVTGRQVADLDPDADYLWLIQPNGVTRRVGIAHWNRDSGQIPAAGSKILVPVKNDDLDPPIPELNQQLAEFIATQLAEVVR